MLVKRSAEFLEPWIWRKYGWDDRLYSLNKKTERPLLPYNPWCTMTPLVVNQILYPLPLFLIVIPHINQFTFHPTYHSPMTGCDLKIINPHIILNKRNFSSRWELQPKRNACYHSNIIIIIIKTKYHSINQHTQATIVVAQANSLLIRGIIVRIRLGTVPPRLGTGIPCLTGISGRSSKNYESHALAIFMNSPGSTSVHLEK